MTRRLGLWRLRAAEAGTGCVFLVFQQRPSLEQLQRGRSDWTTSEEVACHLGAD